MVSATTQPSETSTPTIASGHISRLRAPDTNGSTSSTSSHAMRSASSDASAKQSKVVTSMDLRAEGLEQRVDVRGSDAEDEERQDPEQQRHQQQRHPRTPLDGGHVGERRVLPPVWRDAHVHALEHPEEVAGGQQRPD